MARPSKITDQVVKKLEEAFALGCSVAEACLYADISRQTYYNWIDQNPELFDRFGQLQLTPILKARRCLLGALETNPTLAMRYLERKLPDEFGDKAKPLEEPISKVVVQIVKSKENIAKPE